MNTINETTKPVNHILYHGGYCQDGFMAAYLMKRFLEHLGIEQVQTTAVNYNEPMPDVTNQIVHIVDFSYTPEVIDEARKTADTIYLFDHHEKAAQMWGGYKDISLENEEDRCDFLARLTDSMSGAMIVHSFLKELVTSEKSCLLDIGAPSECVEKATLFVLNERLETLVKRVDDRDRWVFQYEDTNIYRSVLMSVPMTFEAWDKLIFETSDEDFDAMVDKARHYAEKEEQICQSLAKHVEMIQFGGYTVPVANCPAQFGSRVGEIIGACYPFSLTYSLNSKIVYCSLRSNGVNGIDVSAFASKYQGGGHLRAAGFRLTPIQLVELLDGKM